MFGPKNRTFVPHWKIKRLFYTKNTTNVRESQEGAAKFSLLTEAETIFPRGGGAVGKIAEMAGTII